MTSNMMNLLYRVLSLGEFRVLKLVINLFLLTGMILPRESQGQSRIPLTDAVPGEYIVKYKRNGAIGNVRAKVSGKASLKGVLSSGSMYHMSMKSEHVASVQSDPDVEYVEPNYYLTVASSANDGTPNQPLQQLSLSDVTAQSSTTFTQTYAPVQMLSSWSTASSYSAQNRPVVAIVDTGVELNHHVFSQSQALWVNPGEIPNNGIDDDYNGYIDDVYGWNYVAGSNNPNDDEGHGTHVAGSVVGASLDIFSSSIDLSRIRIMPLKFLDAQGAGTTSNAIKAIYYAVNNGAKVINCSWGGGSYSQSLLEALAYAYEKKVLVIAAAGNNGKNNDSVAMYPANYDVPGLLSVAATSDLDNLASFSNYGPTKVPVAAPGVFIYSTFLNNTYATMSGTSMAAPLVSGIAAMASREAPSLTGYQIKSLILSTVDVTSKLSGKTGTSGRVNANKLLQNAITSNSTASYQPNYQVSFKSERDPASDGASSGQSSPSGKAGCGLVSAMGGAGGSGGASGFGFMLIALAPLLVWLTVRMKSTDGRENRTHERYKISSQIRVQFGDKEMVANMSSISMGGLSFNLDNALEKGGIVNMKISSPDGNEQIDVAGKVVWCENNQAYGVQFHESREGALAAIQNWTKGLSKAS